MRTILFALLMLFTTVVNAQDKEKLVSIVGRITDVADGEIMAGVSITNETRNAQVLSKGNGFYSIVAAKGDIIRFAYVGYEPLYMRVNEQASSKETIMIEMEEAVNEIEAVTVSMPSLEELNDFFMDVEVDEDLNREVAERNPETFTILDEIEKPKPGGPVSFLKEAVFDKMKKKKKKPGKKGKLPKYKK